MKLCVRRHLSSSSGRNQLFCGGLKHFVMLLENNQLLDSNNDSVVHRAASHHPVADLFYFSTITAVQVFYSIVIILLL